MLQYVARSLGQIGAKDQLPILLAEFDKENREQLNQQLTKESTRGSAKSRHPTAQLQFLAPVLPLH